jgi:hypothetical protein
LYPGYPGPVVSGSDHLAVRDALPAWTGGSDEVVVSLGGSQPPPQITAALEQLAQLAPDVAFAITGPWAPDGWRRLEPERFWNEAAAAKALVLAAGSAVWEAAVVAVPVILLEIADNQRLTYRWGRDAGVPGLKASLVDSDFLAHQLRALLPAARPLPKVTSGAARVADIVARLATTRGMAR